MKHADLVRRADFCSRREKIVSRDDIVSALTSMTETANRDREAFVAKASQILDATDYQALLVQAEKSRAGAGRIETDPAAFFAAAPESEVGAAIKRICDPRRPSSASFGQ